MKPVASMRLHDLLLQFGICQVLPTHLKMGRVSFVTVVQRERIGKCTAEARARMCARVSVSLFLMKGPLCSKAGDCFDSQ